MALSEAVKEIMFMIQSLQSIKVPIKLPVLVHIDNVGAIFMAGNMTATGHTKHMYIKYKHVNEYIEDDIVFL